MPYIFHSLIYHFSGSCKNTLSINGIINFNMSFMIVTVGDAINTKGQAVVSISDLTTNYGANQVLRGINLNVFQGKTIGYIGLNGA